MHTYGDTLFWIRLFIYSSLVAATSASGAFSSELGAAPSAAFASSLSFLPPKSGNQLGFSNPRSFINYMDKLVVVASWCWRWLGVTTAVKAFDAIATQRSNTIEMKQRDIMVADESVIEIPKKWETRSSPNLQLQRDATYRAYRTWAMHELDNVKRDSK